MKKLLLALALCLGLGPAVAQAPIVGPGQTILCTKIASMTAGPTSLTQVVAAVAGQTIYICGWHVTNTAASGTFSFSTGTGTNCATNTALLIPVSNVTNTAPSADHIDYASMQGPQGAALCITPSVATIAALIYYSQF